MNDENKPTKNITKKERRILIAALVVVPFFYPFLLFWFANAQLDKTYTDALSLPDRYRSIAAPNGICPSDIDKLKDEAHRALGASVGALPGGSKDTLKSLRILGEMEFLPLFGRGLVLWGQLDKSSDIPQAIWMKPEIECQQAGEKLHKAADDLEAALARYGQTRTLMQVILYTWLVAEVLGWIVVIWFTRRFLRERAVAKASASKK